ncbi:hypothetical protein BT69DRAFT_1240281 [Atractiella rhizophila]|nr:hypothetical protein BT69DRAFT_1240281 [Atractiella rhizophila]
MTSDKLWNLLGAPAPFDPSCRYVTSWAFSPGVLLLIRGSIAVYTLTTLVFRVVWDSVRDHDIDSFFSYFTHLCYIGQCAYFFAATVQTYFYRRNLTLRRTHDEEVHEKQLPDNGAAIVPRNRYPLQRWPRILQFLHALLWSTIPIYGFLVTIVYWAILSDNSFDSPFNAWSNVSLHILNSVQAAFEVIFTRTPQPEWLHIPFLIVMLAGYLGVAYITHETQGFYVYDFLNPDNGAGELAGYIVGIAAASAVLLTVCKGIIYARMRWIEKSVGRKQVDEARAEKLMAERDPEV